MDGVETELPFRMGKIDGLLDDRIGGYDEPLPTLDLEREMTRGVAEAATGSGEIATNITGVATATSSNTQVIEQMGESVSELARMSAELRTRVAAFTF